MYTKERAQQIVDEHNSEKHPSPMIKSANKR